MDYFDDICVTGENDPDLLDKVHAVLTRIRDFGFHIRPEKCQLFSDQVKFLGNIIDRNGIRVDPEKTLAVRRLPAPGDEATLRSFLGAVNYYDKYIKSIKVVAYASRTLTKAERAFSQIEREALGLVFAVEHFHRYIYGRKFTLVTDHKPLLVIFGSNKGIAAHAANRIQRWQLIMHAYYFDIQYTSTMEFGYVDMLSRLIDNNQPPEEDFVIACTHLEELCNYELEDAFNRFPITHKQVVQSTETCAQLQNVIGYTKSGWPSSTKDMPKDVTN